MRPVVQLVFVFNHKYEKNVARLDEHYASRFSRPKYIMPFGSGGGPNVIPVAEASWYFNGHISQAAHGYIDPAVTHYVFVADDLILNPALDETNLIERIGLAEGEGYIKSIAAADALRYRWPWAADAAASVRKFGRGFNYRQELPPASEAKAGFEQLGLSFPFPWPRSLRELYYGCLGLALKSPWIYALSFLVVGRRSEYPLLAGYSDFCIVPAAAIRSFVHYCGVFAAMNIFAEIAVPTALVLACSGVKTELQLVELFVDPAAQRQPDAMLHGKELWGDDIKAFGERLAYSIAAKAGLDDSLPVQLRAIW
jgi:hypothetical protein